MDIATSVNPESEVALSSLDKAEVCMETPSVESSFPPEPMMSSRSLSLGPLFSLSLSNSRLNSLSGRSDITPSTPFRWMTSCLVLYQTMMC